MGKIDHHSSRESTEFVYVDDAVEGGGVQILSPYRICVVSAASRYMSQLYDLALRELASDKGAVAGASNREAIDWIDGMERALEAVSTRLHRYPIGHPSNRARVARRVAAQNAGELEPKDLANLEVTGPGGGDRAKRRHRIDIRRQRQIILGPARQKLAALTTEVQKLAESIESAYGTKARERHFISAPVQKHEVLAHIVLSFMAAFKSEEDATRVAENGGISSVIQLGVVLQSDGDSAGEEAMLRSKSASVNSCLEWMQNWISKRGDANDYDKIEVRSRTLFETFADHGALRKKLSSAYDRVWQRVESGE